MASFQQHPVNFHGTSSPFRRKKHLCLWYICFTCGLIHNYEFIPHDILTSLSTLIYWAGLLSYFSLSFSFTVPLIIRNYKIIRMDLFLFCTFNYGKYLLHYFIFLVLYVEVSMGNAWLILHSPVALIILSWSVIELISNFVFIIIFIFHNIEWQRKFVLYNELIKTSIVF